MYVEPNHHLRIAFKNKHTSIHPYNFTFNSPDLLLVTIPCTVVPPSYLTTSEAELTVLYCTVLQQGKQALMILEVIFQAIHAQSIEYCVRGCYE